ncbi:hypothetical protein BDQ12DRAFT_729010 [Crucibulum laeve]|uniref:Acetyl-CoA synthetase-like protein n=1 Tax=Crucibulum laeve TaxID=68775 RepID=A0A5C3LGZ9_9AGAR|nr:hypothetical protein BDQ12DRAFT_729010 [Crucibulum laeve]
MTHLSLSNFETRVMLMEKNFVLPLPVTNQAYSGTACNNFKLPPLDGSLTLPEIYDWHYESNPRHSVFIFENHPRAGYTHLTYTEVVPAIHNAARYIGFVFELDIDNLDKTMSPVALLATSDTVTTFCTILGMMRIGIPIFPISHHNSAAAIARLLQQSGSRHILISVEPSHHKLAQSAIVILHDELESALDVQIAMMPKFEDIFCEDEHIRVAPRTYNLEVPALFIHSSGSTSYPKPMPWTHPFLLQCAVAPLFGAHNYCNEVFAWHSATMSHGAGLHMLAWIVTAGMIAATFPPASPAHTPSAIATFEGLHKSRSEYVVTYPHYIEKWSVSPARVEVMKRSKGLIYVGGFLNTTIGDYLAREGVKLYPLFGMGEAGVIGSFLPENQELDWEYFSLSPHSGGRFINVDIDTYQLVIVKSPQKHLQVKNTTFGSADAYNSGDYFVEHPQKPGFWKVLGRADERLIHSNGEKTDPAPLEHFLNTDIKISGSLVFGNKRERNGVLLQLEKEHYFDPDDASKLAALRNYLWPKLKLLNATTPTQSHLFPEMIITTHSSKSFEYTEKGSLKRKLALLTYEDEINTLYKTIELTPAMRIKMPVDWSFHNILLFVRSVIDEISPNIGDADNIFHHGCSSLDATRLENIIRSSLKSFVEVPENFVYDHPTPILLASLLKSLHGGISYPLMASGDDTSAMDAVFHRLMEMNAAIVKPVIPALNLAPSVGSGVLVTGSTGHLGSNLLIQLLGDSTVSRIYAVNRSSPKGVSLLDRQKAALVYEGLDPDALNSPKLILLEGDLSLPGLGLDPETQEEIKANVTHVMHIAWPVNWKLPLASFERILAGVSNLVHLILASTATDEPRFVFASTVGVFRNALETARVDELPMSNFLSAKGQGYSESKAIAEKYLLASAQTTRLRPIIVRLGQVAGGVNGAWPTSDWVPALLKSSQTLGFLPKVDGMASWMPATLAAKALNEMRASNVEVINLLHPKPVHFSWILQKIGVELNLDTISFEAWISALKQRSPAILDETTLKDLPALQIFDFFDCKRNASKGNASETCGEAIGLPSFNVSNALISSSLSDAAPLSIYDVHLWLAHWKERSYI